MNSVELLNQIFQLCIVPLLGILTAYLVSFIKTKSTEMIAATDNETAKKYLQMLSDTVSTCVVATNQTYVDALKDQNIFDKNAQAEALKKTTEAVKNLLTTEARDYLKQIYGDVDLIIQNEIEEAVYYNKSTSTSVISVDSNSLN